MADNTQGLIKTKQSQSLLASHHSLQRIVQWKWYETKIIVGPTFFPKEIFEIVAKAFIINGKFGKR